MNQNNKKEWRRSKVWELLVKGYNHYEIAYVADSQANHYQIHTISKTTGQGRTSKVLCKKDCHKNMKNV
jgi:hypothetical protein